MTGYYYVATPYSRYPHGISAAFRDAVENTALLVKHGVSAFSPIVHSHILATQGGIDALDGNMWLQIDEPLMDGACGCIVVMMDGWDKSVGVAREINRFTQQRKPVVMMVPGEVPVMP